MTMSAKDGGLAFGGTRFEPNGLGAMRSHSEVVVYAGMSMRDWFAGQALGALATYEGQKFEDLSSMAYRLADAMIAERSK